MIVPGSSSILLKTAVYNFTTCFETSTPPAGTRLRTTAWDNTITHTLTADFSTPAIANEYFRREGAFIWNGSLALSAGSDTFIAPGWRDFLASIPNVTLGRVNTVQGVNTVAIGWDTLTNSPQTVFTKFGSAYYQAGSSVVLTASKLDSVLTITVSMTEGSTNNNGSVVGNMNSMFTLRRASTACIDPAIPYPSVVSSGSM